MHPALLLLLRLRQRAFWRRTLAGSKTPRGAALFAATAAFFVLIVLPQFAMPIFSIFSPQGAKANRQFLEAATPVIRMLAPLVLAAFVLLAVATNWGEYAIYFSPADVDFLFAGPFSRRQLLVYKVIQSIRGGITAGTFFSIFAARYAPLLAGAWLGSVFTLLFMNALTLTLTLVGQIVSQRADSRWRRIVLALAAILVCFGLASTLKDFDPNHVLESVGRFRVSLAGRILATPFEVFPRIVTATSAPELALWTALAAAMVLGLFCLAISLDANYLETAQRVSERYYERIKRRRQGGGAIAAIPISGAHRIRIPRLPWLGGAGPNIWRQWLLLARRSQGLLILIVIVVAMGGMFFVLTRQTSNGSHILVPAAILAGLAYQSLLASMQLPTGFRGDVDRMDWLKSLPLHPAAVVCGQISGAPLLLSLVQATLLIVAWALCGGAYQLYAVGLVLLIPINLFCFGMENLLFLIFPLRMSPATAGDFQFMGKFMLLAMLKMLLLLVGLAIASAGALVYLLIPQLWLAIACCLLLLSIMDTFVVLLATHAFMRFDVSLDTPPA
jgi:hypothetical protein